jgi:hypothetical protein
MGGQQAISSESDMFPRTKRKVGLNIALARIKKRYEINGIVKVGRPTALLAPTSLVANCPYCPK